MADLPTGIGSPRAGGDLYCPPLGNIYSLDAAYCGWPLFVDVEDTSEEAPWPFDQGYLRFDNAIQSVATHLYIRKLSISWTDMTNVMESLIAGVLIRVHKNADPSKYIIFQSTGNPDDLTDFFSLPVVGIWGTEASPFEQDDLVTVSIEFGSADFLSDGGGSGDGCCCLDYEFSTANGDSDPGTGILRFDNEDPENTTEIYIDNADTGSSDVSSKLDAVGSIDHDIAGQVQICSKTDPDEWVIYNIIGVTVDGTGYRKLQVEWVAGNGIFETAESLCVCLVFGQKILTGGGGMSHAQVMARMSGPAGYILSATNQTLEIETTSTASTDIVVSYEDITTSAFTSGSQQTNTITATTTTVLAAPAASTQRRVQSITVRNRDASASQTVTIKKDVAGTEYHFSGALILLAGEHLEYTPAQGIRIFDTVGREKCCGDTPALIQGISANGGLISSGTVIFSDSNNVSFGRAGQTITAFAPFRLTNLASSVQATNLQFSNANNFSWLLSTAASGATLSGSFAETQTFLGGIGGAGGSVTIGTAVFSNANNVSFGFNGSTVTATVASSLTNIKISAGASSVNLSALTFSNSNGMAFGLNGSVITGSYAETQTFLGGVGAAGGTQTSGTLLFSNFNNVSFGFNAGTITASATVATSLTAINISAGATSANLSNLTFSNSNGLAFGLTNSVITGSYTVPTVVNSGLLNITDSASSVNASRLQFNNANGLTLGLSTGASIATITGSYTVPAVVNSGLMNVTDVNSSVNASRLVFSNVNGMTLGLSTGASIGTITGSYTVPAVVNSGLLNITDANSSVNASRLVFSNLNGLTLGLSTAGSIGTITGSYSVPAVINSGLLNITDSVSSVNASRLLFSNANGVTFGINTAGSIATITASVSPGGGGGIAAALAIPVVLDMSAANSVSTVSSGTLHFPLVGGTNVSRANVLFRISNQTILAVARPNYIGSNLTSGFPAENVSFANTNGVSWAIGSSAMTEASLGQAALVSLNYAAPRAISAGGASVSNGTVVFSDSNGLAFGVNGSTLTGSYTVPTVVNSGLINVTDSVSSVNASRIVFSNANGVSFGLATAGSIATLTASVLGQPNRSWCEIVPGEVIQTVYSMANTALTARPIFQPFWLDGDGLQASTIRMFASFASSSNRSLIATSGVALYSFVNSTQLSLFNSTTHAISITAVSQYDGIKLIDFTGMTNTMSAGRWVMALFINPLSSGNSASQVLADGRLYGAQPIPNFNARIVGGVFSASNSTVQIVPGWGLYASTTNAFPNSVNITQILGGNATSAMDLYAIIKEI